MKVFVAVLLAIGSASAIGSGPYLPSGWRPTGPAFYLPSEVQKPANNPIKATILETEASGSEALREYGPPKAQEAPTIVQDLPDVVTDQTFYVVDNVAPEALAERAEIIQTTEADIPTEAPLAFDQTEVTTASYATETDADVTGKEVVEAVDELKEIEAKSAALEEKLDTILVKEESLEYKTQLQNQANILLEQNLENIVLGQNLKNQVQEQKLEDIVIQEEKLTNIVKEEKLENFAQEQKIKNLYLQEDNVEKVVQESAGEAKNIAEALVNLGNEIKSQQVQQTVAAAELRTTPEGSGNAQAPEGFLEYGPPGFREYGPPKGAEPLRTIEANEVRRRRFSPKFRSTKNNKH